MTAQIQTKTIAIQIPVDLYTQLDDNTRYYDWRAGLNNFIKKKLMVVANQEKENNRPDIIDLYPKTKYNKTKMVKVPIELPESVHQQLKHYRKALNWSQEFITFLQEKMNQIEAKKQQSHGLDRPQDIAFPFLTTNKSGDNFITQFLKMGSELTGIPIVERKIENEKTNEKRERVLKDLPEQKLSHFENNAMKNFFREHNFYVTKFPTTPPKEYPIACEILYYYFKYAGARLNGLKAGKYQKELQKRTTIETLQALLYLMNDNLEEIFHSEIIHYIFTLPAEKRIDVEVFDAKTMDQVADFEEKAWTIKEVYPFMDRKEYVVHVYDLNELNCYSIIKSSIELDEFCSIFNQNLTLLRSGLSKSDHIFPGFDLGYEEIKNIPLFHELIFKYYGMTRMTESSWIEKNFLNAGYIFYRMKFNNNKISSGIIFGFNYYPNFGNEFKVTNIKHTVYLEHKLVNELLNALEVEENEGKITRARFHTERMLLIILIYLTNYERPGNTYSTDPEQMNEQLLNIIKFIYKKQEFFSMDWKLHEIRELEITLFTEKYPCSSCKNILIRVNEILKHNIPSFDTIKTRTLLKEYNKDHVYLELDLKDAREELFYEKKDVFVLRNLK